LRSRDVFRHSSARIPKTVVAFKRVYTVGAHKRTSVVNYIHVHSDRHAYNHSDSLPDAQFACYILVATSVNSLRYNLHSSPCLSHVDCCHTVLLGYGHGLHPANRPPMQRAIWFYSEPSTAGPTIGDDNITSAFYLRSKLLAQTVAIR